MTKSSPSPVRRPLAPPAGVLRILALVAALSLAASPAEATWRCGARLVAIGDSASRVLSRCGEPSYRSDSTEIVSLLVAPDEQLTRIVAIETWTYDRGPHEFVRLLTFRDGYLENIAEDGYGTEW
jgi:hypothetical protein